MTEEEEEEASSSSSNAFEELCTGLLLSEMFLHTAGIRQIFSLNLS